MKAFHLLFGALILFLLPSLLHAQVPQRIPYRAMLKMNGNVLSNQTIDMRFTILESGTNTVYQEVQTLTTNAVGLVSSAVGAGTPISGTLSSIAWDQGDYSMKVEFDNGGWINLGTTPLETVPFAFHAQTVANDSTNSYEIGLNGNELILLENGSPTDSLDLSTIGITNGDTASGDLGQFYPNPEVWGLAGNPIATSATNPMDGNVLKWSSVLGLWVPEVDAVAINPGAITNTSSPLIGDGSSVTPVTIGQNGASTGQVLKWNGVFWEALNDSINTYQAGIGININGTVITNTGDTDPADDITTSTVAGGDLDGFYPNPTVVGIQGIPVSPNTTLQGNDILKFIGGQWTYVQDDTADDDADPTNEFQVLTVDPINWTASIAPNGNTVSLPQYIQGPGISIDPSGWILSNTGDLDPNDDVIFGSPAGGDLSGTYPNPTVSGIQGTAVSSASPLSGQVLKFIGGQWIPASDVFEDADSDPTNEIQDISQNGNQLSLSSGGTVTLFTAGQGISVVGNQISSTGDLNPFDDVTIGSTAGGDLGGTYPNPVVQGIHGFPISPLPPSNGQVYVFDSSLPGWVLGSADTDASDDITTSTSAGGDLNGLYPSPTVIAIQGRSISNTTPQTGEVLTWTGTEWEADANNSPWTQAGNDLSYSTGDVGIGTASPASELSVGGTATVLNAAGDVRVEAGTDTNDGGFVRIMDTNDQILAGMFINALGEGDLFADTKNFRVDHPTEPDKDIWYASLEGPEAAAYVRGTATLQDGKVVVDLPDHFELIAGNEGMTVMLTPLSAESKGLAVIQKDVTHFEVQELLQGSGNYSFDWEVKAVRKGHENFQVIRPTLSPRK